jgi:hypothetical protein
MLAVLVACSGRIAFLFGFVLLSLLHYEGENDESEQWLARESNQETSDPE